jgi:hypothetical protein
MVPQESNIFICNSPSLDKLYHNLTKWVIQNSNKIKKNVKGWEENYFTYLVFTI